MSIADKIKKLQDIQNKIDSFNRFIAYMESNPLTYEDIGGDLVKFAKKSIKDLDNSGDVAPVTSRPVATPRILKDVDAIEPPPHEDPLTFALKWKRNEGKDVEFDTKDGTIQGTIRGVNPPNVVVETKTGITITVPPRELTIKGA